MLKVLIVDDEPKAQKILTTLLLQYTKDIQIVGVASSAQEALEKIKATHPQLVFLDINMPGQDGFSVLASLKKITFEVVITTAYSEYALNAIKFSAIDYLLKPIDLGELQAAIQKCQEKIKTQKNESVLFLPSLFFDTQKQVGKIALPIAKGFEIITIADIVYCEASGSYTLINTSNNQQFTVAKNLKFFETKLAETGFLRLHDSFLVNTQHVVRVIKGKPTKVSISTGIEIEVSRSRKSTSMQYFKL
ncbi:MAG: LytR/AlgR family response regulator transcription factor [Aureispira sp.]